MIIFFFIIKEENGVGLFSLSERERRELVFLFLIIINDKEAHVSLF